MPWSDVQKVVDDLPKPQDRPDCPVCGEVLEHNGKVWNCPRWGAEHYRSTSLPRD